MPARLHEPLWPCLIALASWAAAPISPSQARDAAGPLVIAGGSITSSHEEIWDAIFAARLDGRPIGIISTASEDPAAVGIPFAERLNRERGDGSALFIPLGTEGSSSADPEISERIRRCGGFYFTGGLQTRTTRVLLDPSGDPSPALTAIREIHAAGGVVGGSSAGAAVMSDPMISGGSSREALLRGATPTGTPSEARGVSYAPGLGFHQGVLYCQHHLERGRFGRLLAALASEATGLRFGVGVAEDTAMLVSPDRLRGQVVGAKGALYIDASAARSTPAGEIEGVRLHYLDRGDRVDFGSGAVIPAEGKVKSLPETPSNSLPSVGLWDRDAVWELVVALAENPALESIAAEDGRFELSLSRTAKTETWRHPLESAESRPTWTVTQLAVRVAPKRAGSSQAP